MSAECEAFQKYQDHIDPLVIELFEALGDSGLEVYGSQNLVHNTLASLVPVILEGGMNEARVVPDEEDIEFAAELFEEKGFFYPDNKEDFDLYIRGRHGEQEPGNFFFQVGEISLKNIVETYGIPERVSIFAQEMFAIANIDNKGYTPEERAHAAKLHEKYITLLKQKGAPDAAILQVDPFAPPVINQRLRPMAQKILAKEGSFESGHLLDLYDALTPPRFNHGVFIVGTVDAEYLTDTGLRFEAHWDQTMKPENSRYFYIPDHLKKIGQ